MAHKVLQTSQQEAQLVRLLLEAADHEITSCDKEVKIKELEVKLAESKREEARLRHDYYAHVHEAVGDKVCNAEMQAAVLRLEGREAGIPVPGILGSGISLRVQGTPLLLKFWPPMNILSVLEATELSGKITAVFD